MDPLAGSPWSSPGTVAGFAQALPNDVLVRFAEQELRRPGHARALDLGCGAGRNAVPLARQGWAVVGTDMSWPMLEAAAARAAKEGVSERVRLILAPMERLPLGDRTCDLIVAHGIWNLARSGTQFRAAVGEAARVAHPGTALFVFTFSRHTLPAETVPVTNETFVFTEFSGQPQCFLTEAQLITEVGAFGFVPDDAFTLTEYNRPLPGALCGGGPVIYEAAFRWRG